MLSLGLLGAQPNLEFGAKKNSRKLRKPNPYRLDYAHSIRLWHKNLVGPKNHSNNWMNLLSAGIKFKLACRCVIC